MNDSWPAQAPAKSDGDTAEPAKKNVLLRLLSAVWTGVDTFRKLLHLFLLLFVFMIVFGMLSSTAPVIPAQAVLEIRPQGFLVEEREGDPFDLALQELVGDAPPQTVLRDLVDALHFARDDDRIRAVHLDLGGFLGGGLPKLQRVVDAIADFRGSGKTVIASGDFYTQAGYYIAAHADETYMHPEGLVLLQGYGSYRTYFSDAIEKLKIDWNIFRVGTHKSFVEPYTRMSMSDEAREDVERLTSQLWQQYRADVVNARGLDDGTIDRFADDLIAIVEAADGDLARAALEHGLVDELLSRGEVRERLIEIVGPDPDFSDAPKAAGMRGYLTQIRLLDGEQVKDKNVAVIVAAGDITFGSPPPGSIGSESTSYLLRRALNDDSVAAVVLRIDSPGGSALASDVISAEIDALREAGKPVVASMSSVAASGGYWIAAGADRIFASPATVTGSIGIFAMFPTFQRTLETLGVSVDGTGSTMWAGEFRPDRELSPHARRLLQLAIEEGYDDFVSRVARYRGMEKAEVDAIGQGRVWTGVDALEKGLVDQLGDLDDAVEAAAGLAGIDGEDYGRKFIRDELSPGEQLIVDLLGTAPRFGVDIARLFERPPSALNRIAARIESEISPLLRFEDPKGTYAHCLCQID